MGNLTGQRALDAVEVGEAVGPLGGWVPRGGGPQVGLQTVEGRQAAVILDTRHRSLVSWGEVITLCPRRKSLFLPLVEALGTV